MKNTIACVGNLTKDHLFWVDRLPEIDDVSTIRSHDECYGGRAAIVAMILSSLGCEANIISTIPSVDSVELERFLSSRKCSTLGLDFDENASSHNKVLITIGREEENCTSLYLPGDCKVTPSVRQLSLINDAAIVYFTSHEIDASVFILNSLNLQTTNIIVNVSSYMIESEEYLSLIMEGAKIIICNEGEFKSLKEKLTLSNYHETFDHFKRLDGLIVTQGAQGVYYHSSQGIELSLPALTVQVRTPVGIGDAFIAGIIYGEFHHLEPEQSIKIGLRLAATSIESNESCPSYEDIIKAV